MCAPNQCLDLFFHAKQADFIVLTNLFATLVPQLSPGFLHCR